MRNINDFEEQATNDKHPQVLDVDLFAELIVRKCIEISKHFEGAEDVEWEILSHFDLPHKWKKR
jgi:hypothetical protein